MAALTQELAVFLLYSQLSYKRQAAMHAIDIKDWDTYAGLSLEIDYWSRQLGLI